MTLPLSYSRLGQDLPSLSLQQLVSPAMTLAPRGHRRGLERPPVRHPPRARLGGVSRRPAGPAACSTIDLWL